MTSNQQRLEELRQRAKALAEQIDQLEEQISSAQPPSGLLGRWATNRDGKRVLITTDRPVDGWIETTYVKPDGTTREKAEQLDSLSFPDQTTRPEDVPVGEAWLANVNDGNLNAQRISTIKMHQDLWMSEGVGDPHESYWSDNEVTLITPLIPAHPHDTPETVTTEEEYGALPEGSIVAEPGFLSWNNCGYAWVYRDYSRSAAEMAGTTRQVLRRGWGE